MHSTWTRRNQHSQECKTHASTAFVPRDIEILTFLPNKWFIGLLVVHFYVKFGDPGCIGIWDIVRKKQTDRQTNTTPLKTLPTRL